MTTVAPACGETGRLFFWSDALTRTLISGIGVYFIVHGSYLMVVLPDERFPPESLFSVAIGTDNKVYSPTKVIQFARLMMVILGSLLVVLPWIMPIAHLIRTMRSHVPPIHPPGRTVGVGYGTPKSPPP